MRELILGLAIFRITHLIVVDAFPPIAWVRRKISELDNWISYLFNCEWCMSIWVGGFVVIIFDRNQSFADQIFTILAASGFTGLLATWVGDH